VSKVPDWVVDATVETLDWILSRRSPPTVEEAQMVFDAKCDRHCPYVRINSRLGAALLQKLLVIEKGRVRAQVLRSGRSFISVDGQVVLDGGKRARD
jgi:hypothetical protein